MIESIKSDKTNLDQLKELLLHLDDFHLEEEDEETKKDIIENQVYFIEM